MLHLLEIEQNKLEFVQKSLNTLNRVASEGASAEREAAFIDNRKKFFEDQLKELDSEAEEIQFIIDKYQVPLSFFDKETKTGEGKKADKKALQGTLAFLEQEVSRISNKLENELIIGSDKFVDSLDELAAAQKRLKDARDLLNLPEESELFTQGSLNALRKQASELQKIIDGLPKGEELSKKAEELRAVTKQIKELEDIINPEEKKGKTTAELLEEKKNQLLAILGEEQRYELESANIKEKSDAEKLELELEFLRERRKILTENGGTEEELQQNANDIDLLLQRLGKAYEDIKKKNRELIQEIVNGFVDVIQQAVDATRQILSIKQAETDQLISIQQGRVDEAREIADRGNSAILEAEQQRLDELYRQQAEYAKKQQNLATLQIVTQSALAIAKAAAEGGVLAPFTIAATLIALTAGLAQARAQAQAAVSSGSFKEGGYTGDGDPSAVSTKLGRKPYEYHKGEFVMPHEVTNLGNNRKWFAKIMNERISIDHLVKDKSPTVIVNNDNKQVIEAIEKIPQTMFAVDKNGVFKIVTRNLSKEQRRQQLRRRK